MKICLMMMLGFVFLPVLFAKAQVVPGQRFVCRGFWDSRNRIVEMSAIIQSADVLYDAHFDNITKSTASEANRAFKILLPQYQNLNAFNINGDGLRGDFLLLPKDLGGAETFKGYIARPPLRQYSVVSELDCQLQN